MQIKCFAKISCSLGIAICLILGLVDGLAQAQDLTERDATGDPAEFLRALQINYEAVNRFDCLLKIEGQTVGEGIHIQQNSALRFAMDRLRGRATTIKVQEHFDELKDIRQYQATSAVSTTDGVWWTRFPDEQKYLPGRSLVKMLSYQGAVDPLVVGLGFFPRVVKSEKDVLQKWDRNAGLIQTYGSIGEANGRIVVDVKMPYKPSKFGKISIHWQYLLDPETQLPSNYSMWNRSRVDGNDSSKLHHKYTVEWKEFASGIYLPVKIHTLGNSARLDADGKVLKTQTTKTGRIHWFSVNEDIEPRLWDHSLWGDYDQAQAACDFPDFAPHVEDIKRPLPPEKKG